MRRYFASIATNVSLSCVGRAQTERRGPRTLRSPVQRVARVGTAPLAPRAIKHPTGRLTYRLRRPPTADVGSSAPNGHVSRSPLLARDNPPGCVPRTYAVRLGPRLTTLHSVQPMLELAPSPPERGRRPDSSTRNHHAGCAGRARTEARSRSARSVSQRR